SSTAAPGVRPLAYLQWASGRDPDLALSAAQTLPRHLTPAQGFRARYSALFAIAFGCLGWRTSLDPDGGCGHPGPSPGPLPRRQSFVQRGLAPRCSRRLEKLMTPVGFLPTLGWSLSIIVSCLTGRRCGLAVPSPEAPLIRRPRQTLDGNAVRRSPYDGGTI